jgi:hypothetical protein
VACLDIFYKIGVFLLSQLDILQILRVYGIILVLFLFERLDMGLLLLLTLLKYLVNTGLERFLLLIVDVDAFFLLLEMGDISSSKGSLVLFDELGRLSLLLLNEAFEIAVLGSDIVLEILVLLGLPANFV